MRTFVLAMLMLATAGFVLTSYQLYRDIFIDLRFDFIHLLILSWGCSIVALVLSLTWLPRIFEEREV